MKIGIVTHYDVHNHGAQLQMYALSKILKELNQEVIILTFDKDMRYMKNLENKYKISFKSIPFYIKYLLTKGTTKTLYNIRKRSILNKFKKGNFYFEDYYLSNIEILIVGSDEVFSTEAGLSDAFWGENKKCLKKISYAASFGPMSYDKICEKKEIGFITKALNNFNGISVRDKNSYDIIKALGYSSEMVCDPVILYGFKQEIQTMKKINEEYLLVYSYDNNLNSPKEIAFIKAYAFKKQLKIYSVGFYHKWCDKNINCDPIELLNYIRNAKNIITDTFHGSVMSIICNVPFAVIIRNNSNKLSNLLNEYGLDNIINDNFSNMEAIINRIDYNKINSLVEKNRSDSFRFLKNNVLGGLNEY